jgi:hypothetical protein
MGRLTCWAYTALFCNSLAMAPWCRNMWQFEELYMNCISLVFFFGGLLTENTAIHKRNQMSHKCVSNKKTILTQTKIIRDVKSKHFKAISLKYE